MKENDRLNIEKVISIISKIAKAVEFIHLNNLYHGNLSPRNILINDKLDIRVMDFLITKANDGENIRTVDLKYLAPQQISISYTDYESDFYCIGLILFELMFKKFPYECSKDDILMLKNMDKRINWNDYNYLVQSKELFELCKKLLSRANKYRNIKDIIFDVSSIMYKKADIKETPKVNIEKVVDSEEKTLTKKNSNNKNLEINKKSNDKKYIIIIIIFLMIITMFTSILFI